MKAKLTVIALLSIASLGAQADVHTYTFSWNAVVQQLYFPTPPDCTVPGSCENPPLDYDGGSFTATAYGDDGTFDANDGSLSYDMTVQDGNIVSFSASYDFSDGWGPENASFSGTSSGNVFVVGNGLGGGDYDVVGETSTAPEPGNVALMMAGLGLVAAMARRRRGPAARDAAAAAGAVVVGSGATI